MGKLGRNRAEPAEAGVRDRHVLEGDLRRGRRQEKVERGETAPAKEAHEEEHKRIGAACGVHEVVVEEKRGNQKELREEDRVDHGEDLLGQGKVEHATLLDVTGGSESTKEAERAEGTLGVRLSKVGESTAAQRERLLGRRLRESRFRLELQ